MKVFRSLRWGLNEWSSRNSTSMKQGFAAEFLYLGAQPRPNERSLARCHLHAPSPLLGDGTSSSFSRKTFLLKFEINQFSGAFAAPVSSKKRVNKIFMDDIYFRLLFDDGEDRVKCHSHEYGNPRVLNPSPI